MAISHNDLPYKHLAQVLAPGSTLLRAWSLKGGISAEMTALEIRQPDGAVRRMIARRPGIGALRHNPRAAADEFKLLQFTLSKGLATPAPLYLDAEGKIFGAPGLVIDYVEGGPDFAPASLDEFAQQFAAHLARIHQVDGADPALASLPGPAQAYIDVCGERRPDADESLDEGRIRATLARVWPLKTRNAPALLHGDYWPGNVLWRDGRLVAVIDWEDTRRGDPLTDFAISRLDMLWIFGAGALDAFTRAYQSMMLIDYADLPYWDLCAALRLARLAGADLHGWAAFFESYGRHDITAQTIRAHYRDFVAQAYTQLVT
jgi:aminoglycoside phosphotransferase (APT) family kinase protein